jgi:hypothetical protein
MLWVEVFAVLPQKPPPTTTGLMLVHGLPSTRYSFLVVRACEKKKEIIQ